MWSASKHRLKTYIRGGVCVQLHSAMEKDLVDLVFVLAGALLFLVVAVYEYVYPGDHGYSLYSDSDQLILGLTDDEYMEYVSRQQVEIDDHDSARDTESEKEE